MLEVATANYRRQRSLGAATVAAVTTLWDRVDGAALDASYAAILPLVVQRVTASQLLAAHLATQYVPQVLHEQRINPKNVGTVNPRAFSGTASDGRDLAGLLVGPIITTKAAIGTGWAVERALQAGQAAMTRLAATQVADAGRDAESVGMAATPAVQGWVRMLSLPSCSRCAVLAGGFYRWSSGFERHPNCDCRHIPTNEDVSGDLTTSPREAIASGQVHGLSVDDTKAIVDDGADPGQVINARRGMQTSSAFGQKLSATTEGTTRRGVSGRQDAADGRRPGATPRLRPDEIYKQAGDDRAKAVVLLRRYGYLL